MPDATQNVPPDGADAITYAAIVEADGDAWATIVNQTQRYLMVVVNAQGASWEEADELTQVTYAKAWERRHQFGLDQQYAAGALRAWLTQIAVNTWRDLLRHRTAKHVRIVDHCDLNDQHAWLYDNTPAHDLTAEQATVRAEEMAAAAATIARLADRISPQHRARVHLLLDAHNGYAQRSGAPRVDIRRVMAATGLKRSAAKSSMHRVRMALRHQALLEHLEATS